MYNVLLAQIAVKSSEALSKQPLSLWELAGQGGVLMIPIVICSFISVYVLIERMLMIKKASNNPDAFITKIKKMILKGDIEEAQVLCSQFNSPIARMIEKGVSKIGSPMKNIEVAIENIAKIELFKLEKNISILATISGAAPMIGFLGTVTGMVQAFMSIAQEEGSVSPKLLSSGIYTAMLTTVAGLIVGIISYLGYNYLVTRVSSVVHKMEYASIEFIEMLQEPKK